MKAVFATLVAGALATESSAPIATVDEIGSSVFRTCNAYPGGQASQTGLCRSSLGPTVVLNNGHCACATGYCSQETFNNICTGCANIEVQTETALPAAQRQYSQYFDGVYTAEGFDQVTGRYSYRHSKLNAFIYYLDDTYGYIFSTLPKASNPQGAHSIRSNSVAQENIKALNPIEATKWYYITATGAYEDSQNRIQFRCRDKVEMPRI